LDRSYSAGPPLCGKLTADAVVVGAGITGIALAGLLQGRGLKTVVLERDTVAGGASGRNAGFLVSGLGEHYARSVEFWGRESAAAITRYHIENHALLAEAVARHKIDCGYSRSGGFVIGADEAEEELLRRSHPLLLNDGFPSEFFESTEINRTLGTCAFGGGLFNPLDGCIDPVRLTRGLAATFQRTGVVLFERSSVRRIRREGASLVLEAGEGRVTASLVCLANNAWAPLLVPVTTLEPVRGQSSAAGPETVPSMAVPCYTNYGSEYWRGTGSHLILGGMRRAETGTGTGYEEIPTGSVQRALDKFREDHFPRLKGIPVSHRWSGIMSYSGDGLPVIGAVPGHKGIFLAAGYTGHGLAWAMLAARWLTHLAVDGDCEIPELCRIDRTMRISPALKEV
jgi:glycine/D-amino acid oxidase-like deaminating enzyme